MRRLLDWFLTWLTSDFADDPMLHHNPKRGRSGEIRVSREVWDEDLEVPR